jgi:hypothetical protein
MTQHQLHLAGAAAMAAAARRYIDGEHVRQELANNTAQAIIGGGDPCDAAGTAIRHRMVKFSLDVSDPEMCAAMMALAWADAMSAGGEMAVWGEAA